MFDDGCPYCGCTDTRLWANGATVAVVCSCCGAHGPTARDGFNARKAWTKRITICDICKYKPKCDRVEPMCFQSSDCTNPFNKGAEYASRREHPAKVS